MKKRLFALLLALVMVMGTATGCSSPEDTISKINIETTAETRTENDWVKLIKAYEKLDDTESAKVAVVQAMGYYPNSSKLQRLAEKYLDAAPTVDMAPGTYEGVTKLTFTTEDYTEGEFYIMVDRDDEYFWLAEEDESVVDDGLKIYDFPAERDFDVGLDTAGSHKVKAFVVKDGSLVSQVFTGEYTIEGDDLSGFAFAKESGTYDGPLEVTFKNADDCTIWYTLDGEEGFASHDKKEAKNGVIKLPSGLHKVTARCEAEDGLLSPLITAEYDVWTQFDSASNLVEEDREYDYVCKNGTFGPSGMVLRIDRKTGIQENILDEWVTHIAIYADESASTASEQNIVTGHPERPFSGEDAIKSLMYVRLDNDKIQKTFLINGKTGDWEDVADHRPFERVGRGWFKGDSTHAFWNSDKEKQGVKEVANVADLMLDDIAIYTKRTGPNKSEWSVYACNSDGTNERVLWVEAEKEPVLDAMTDKVILYHKGSGKNIQHMVYYLNTGKHTKNPYVEDGKPLFGYTSTAAYILHMSSVKRVEIDYSTF